VRNIAGYDAFDYGGVAEVFAANTGAPTVPAPGEGTRCLVAGDPAVSDHRAAFVAANTGAIVSITICDCEPR
jgi:hypothetical protein